MKNNLSRQIIYHSTARGKVDTAAILEQSRHNNAIDGVTGVLWSNGRTFVQVLEGPPLSVTEAFVRIGRDTRHEAVTILSDRQLPTSEFGSWSMAERSLDDVDDVAFAKLKQRIADLPADIQERFLEATR